MENTGYVRVTCLSCLCVLYNNIDHMYVCVCLCLLRVCLCVPNNAYDNDDGDKSIMLSTV